MMFLKRINVLAIVLSFSWMSHLSAGDGKPAPIAYPGYEKPSCLAQPELVEYSDAYNKGVEKAKLALQKPYTSPEGVWNAEILSKKPHLKVAIQEYNEGKKGKSIRDIKITGKKPDDLHKELIAAGFEFERIPLLALYQDKVRKFWRRDGTKTMDPQDAQIVPVDIYAHPDGGIIRIKPEGIPSLKHPRSLPEASKGVVYNTTAKDGKVFDTGYKNIAFHVSENGIPLPKEFWPMHGLRLIFDRKEISKMKDPRAARDELRGWITTIMSRANISLPADFNHCAKQVLVKKVVRETSAAATPSVEAVKTEDKKK